MPPLQSTPRALLWSAFILTGLPAFAQTTAAPAAATPAVAPLTEKTLELSPFQVNTSKDQGYQAISSLSGTRLNSKLEDLASTISVVRKEQLTDTAAVDINDVFLYEANTEGMGQFTQFTIDRSFYVEDTTLNPQSANRIRGLGSANMAANNFTQSSVVPIDTYNVDAIEISRGPNGSLAGLGNASGTVNVITGQANLTRNSNQVALRGDAYGGWRSQLNVNRVLVPNKLALRLAAVHDNKGFERQPAYESINRWTGAASIRPFKETTFRVSYENYNNHFSRANTTLPRDSISEWLANGQPVWNPGFGANGGWRPLNGSTYTAVTSANEGAQLPLGLLPGGTGFWANPSVYIDGSGSVGLYAMNAAATGLTSPANGTVYRYVETGNIYRRGSDITKSPATPLILFQAPSITNPAIYDYKSLNYLAPNFGRDEARIWNISLDQGLLRTPRQRLDMQLGHHREKINRYDHSVFSRSDSATPFLGVDINEFLLDGTTNPYFLRPYMGGSQPTIKYSKERNTDSLAQLAYQLDLTQEAGWLHWLGRHNLMGFLERRDMTVTSLTGRDLNVNDYAWTAVNDLSSLPLRGNLYRIYPRYYVGDKVTNGGQVYDYAPATRFSLGNTPFTWFNSNRARVDEATKISEIIQSGSARDREIRTWNATWQGFFWNDRIIPTISWRKDKNRERPSRNLNSNNPATNATSTIDPATRLHNLTLLKAFTAPWDEKMGQSRTAGIVVKVTPWLNLNYSRSNSFKPEALAYGINNNVLENPTGLTTDYGVTLKLFEDKLVARLTHYDTQEKNSRNGSITSAAVTRTLRLFFDPGTSSPVAGATATGGFFPNNQDAFDLEQAAAQWYIQNNTSATSIQAQQWAVDTYLAPMGLTQEFLAAARVIGSSGFTDVNTVRSKGTEFELTYNPSKYWTMKLAGAQQQAVDTELGNAVNDFINSRLDALRAIIVPTTPMTVSGGTGNGTAGKQWWRVGATSATASGTATPSGFYVANVKSVIGLATANAGKPRAQTREYRANFTTNYKLAGLFPSGWLSRTSVGGAVRWESRASVGYYGKPPSTDPEYSGAVIEYDAARPIYDKARAYFDFFASHDLQLWKDHVRCRLQLNVRDAFEGGRLQAIGYNPDGAAWNYRIIDPRQVILTATFDF